jgi:hypothetical protein
VIRIHGCSDDLIEIDGDIREEFSYQDGTVVYVACSNGSLVKIFYGPDGEWRLSMVRVEPETIYIKHEPPHGIVGVANYSDLIIIDDSIDWAVCGRGAIRE